MCPCHLFISQFKEQTVTIMKNANLNCFLCKYRVEFRDNLYVIASEFIKLMLNLLLGVKQWVVNKLKIIQRSLQKWQKDSSEMLNFDDVD